MLQGAFHSYRHDHYFETWNDGTLMKDIVRFAAPYCVLGLVVERLVLEKHMRKLLEQRNLYIKRAAEDGQYKKYLGSQLPT
jgi:ligand-binding SRPBCC domain-containing protein